MDIDLSSPLGTMRAYIDVSVITGAGHGSLFGLTDNAPKWVVQNDDTTTIIQMLSDDEQELLYIDCQLSTNTNLTTFLKSVEHQSIPDVIFVCGFLSYVAKRFPDVDFALNWALSIYGLLPFRLDGSPRSRKELVKLSRRVDVNTDYYQLAFTPTDAIRFLMLLAPRITTMEWWGSIANLHHTITDMVLNARITEWYWELAKLHFSKHPYVDIQGIRINIPRDPYYLNLLWYIWSSFNIVDHLGANQEVFRSLYPRREYSFLTIPSVDTPAPIRVLEEIIVALVEEGNKNRRYAPYGVFNILFPPEIPYVEKGVIGLRVFVSSDDPNVIWYRLLDESGKPAGSILWWSAEAPLDIKKHSLFNETSWMDVVLAGIWRDLVVAAPQALPEASRRKQTSSISPSNAFKRKREKRKRGKRGMESRRSFPRRTTVKAIKMAGSYQWGTPDERERVRRRAHLVSGFIRRLPPRHRASDSARENALRYGVVLPDGYTWVRPHTRGGNPELESVDTLAHMRGLSTIMAITAFETTQEE